MEQEKNFEDISNLPPEAQRQVVDFIAFLRTRYKSPEKKWQIKRIDLVNEPFIGLWKGREDMSDSSKWLRKVREAEWGKTN